MRMTVMMCIVEVVTCLVLVTSRLGFNVTIKKKLHGDLILALDYNSDGHTQRRGLP